MHLFRSARHIITAAILSAVASAEAAAVTPNAVVADSAGRSPLPGASVFDRNGKTIGVCNARGRMPLAAPGDYPLTVRYLGFREKTVDDASADTIFLQEIFTELPEVTVFSKLHQVLHSLAYVREYSTLSTTTDTIFLFREKMVDFMEPAGPHVKFRGWMRPRVLKSKSYYRFTDNWGLDSVSDDSHQHFSWSDWVGLPPSTALSPALRDADEATDTVHSKYTPSEIWTRHNSRVAVSVDVLSDRREQRWTPLLDSFMRQGVEFYDLRLRLNYDNVAGDSVLPRDIARYSYNIESEGRGHDMFMFNSVRESYNVNTYAEVYMLDKEFITVKEARKWEKMNIDTDAITIVQPDDAPELQPSVKMLVARVNSDDKEQKRLAMEPNRRLIGPEARPQTFGGRLLGLFKGMLGITKWRSEKKWDKKWDQFKNEQSRHNRGKESGE